MVTPPCRRFLYAPQRGGPVRSSGTVWRRFTTYPVLRGYSRINGSRRAHSSSFNLILSFVHAGKPLPGKRVGSIYSETSYSQPSSHASWNDCPALP